MVRSEPNEKRETSNMADFNFEEYSDVFEDTQEPIDFEALSDIFEDTGVPTEEMAFESSMEAKKMSTATRSLTTEERATSLGMNIPAESPTPQIRPEGLGGFESPIPQIRPESIVEQLPAEVAEVVKDLKPKTDKEVTEAIFDGTKFSGDIPTPSPNEDIITWISNNAYGITEDNKDFQKAMKGLTQGLSIDKQPWCGSFAGHILRNVGAELPERAKLNPNLAYNYQFLGEDVYNHNPTTKKTYSGSLGDVKAGDVIVFNKNPSRQSNGDFSYGQGHISFVVKVETDGTIVALGGNQKDRVQSSRYTPDVVKKYYPGGFRIRRLSNESLRNTPPSVIAAVTANMATGGAGK